MRTSLALKLLLTYVLIAGGFLLITVDGIQTFQQLGTDVQQLVVQDLQRVTLGRELRSSLVQLDRSQQLMPGQTTQATIDYLRTNRRQFERHLRKLERLSPDDAQQLDRLYQAYLSSLSQQETLPFSRSGLEMVPYGRLLDRIDVLLFSAEQDLRDHQRQLIELPSHATLRLLSIYLAIFILGLGLFAVLGYRILAVIRRYRACVAAYTQGDFDSSPGPRSRDELGALGDDLQRMAQRLKSTRQLFLDASPLTYLPGNIAIERALTKRLRNQEVFALCYIDLDDFKPFNDHYGYAKGSAVIKATAEVIHAAQREAGDERDFVGHIGGDDFVLVTCMDRIHEVCGAIIDKFDRMIPDFYTDEDRQQGGIVAQDRFGHEREFPLMTISVAVVTNANREVSNPIEIAKIAAEIKEYVKMMPGSNYLIDRRTDSRA